MYLSLGEMIRTLRLRQGLSQAELARRATLSRNEISLSERDATHLELRTLQRIAEALGYRLVVSFGLVGSEQPAAEETQDA